MIKTNFEEVIKAKEIPYQYQEIEGDNHLFVFRFNLGGGDYQTAEVIIGQAGEDAYVDAQVIFRFVHFLQDYSLRDQALEAMNDLNAMRTGYYCLHLAGDGEMFMRSLLRVGEDPEPLYQTLYAGARIVKGLQPQLVQTLGQPAPTDF